ncbi:MAG: DPP IV N-terminal domain-containing protein [Bdellovibrionota bacterium]
MTSKQFTEDKTFNNESFETFQKGASLTEKYIVFSVKKSATDELRIIPYSYDGKKKKFRFDEELRYFWKSIDRIQDAVMIDNQTVAFIGYQEGFSNIYLANLEKSSAEKITKGQAHYSDLEYSPATGLLYFSREGDRDPKYIFYDRNLFSLDLKTRLIRQLTNTSKIIEVQPRISKDGKTR